MRDLPNPNRRLLSANDGHSPALEPGGTGTVSLSRFFGILRRHYKLILALTVVGGGLGGFLASREPPSYRAVATLRLANERQSLTGNMEDAPQGASRYVDPLLSLVELIKSRGVAGAVVDSMGLQLTSKTPEFQMKLVDNIKLDQSAVGDSIQLRFYHNGVLARRGTQESRAAYGYPSDLGTVRFTVLAAPEVETAVLAIVPRESAIDGLLGGLVVFSRSGTDVIDVEYVSDNPVRSQRVVNTAAQSFISMNVVTATNKSRRRREFLAEQLAQTDSMLAQAQGQLSVFRSRHELANSRDKLQAQQNAIMALEARQAELEADRRTFATLMTQLKGGNETLRAEALRALATSPAMGDNPAVGSLYNQLTNYQTRIDSLTSGPYPSAPTNPDLLQLRSQLQSTTKNLVQAVASHLGALDARIASLAALRARSATTIEILPAMAEEEARLTRRVDALANMGDQLRQEYQKARMSEAVEAGDVDIVDLADLPYATLTASTSFKVGLGLLLGLILGVAGAFLLEAVNTSIRRPEDLEIMLQVPGLAVIPRLSPASSAGRPRLPSLTGGGSKPGAAQNRAAMLGSATQPFSVGIEAFRMLRTSLIWSSPGEQLRSLVVTSAAPGEGKTLTAANLAVTFAHDALRVLLIDCDVRRPRLHGLFRVPRSPGLMDLLTARNGGGQSGAGSLSFDPDALDSGSDNPASVVTRSTGVKGLSLLTCGALPTNASTLLSGAKMRALMAELSKSYDLLILDTPPALATADAGILAALTDGVLLVVRAGQTDRAAAQRAHQLLSNVGARIIGTVLNDPGGEVSQFGDYYYPYDYSVEQD
jgi:polysaccharide biosynthesis transport protein